MMKLSRRKFLTYTGIGAGAALITTTAAGAANTTSTISTTSLTVPLKHYEGEKVRMAFLSDIHLGPFLDRAMLSDALQMVKESKPDLLVLGGDYLWLPDSSLSSMFQSMRRNFDGIKYRDLPDAIFDQLRTLLSPLDFPFGVYAVYGNHDRWIDPKLCEKALEKAGVKLLVNDLSEINVRGSSVKLFGTDDYWTGVPANPPFQKNSKREDIRIVVSHNPDFQGELLARADIDYDFGIGGHTHGGQVCLPLYGALFYNITDHRFCSGLTSVGNTSIFTSRGLGTVEIPYRLNCPAEVAIIDFVGI